MGGGGGRGSSFDSAAPNNTLISHYIQNPLQDRNVSQPFTMIL